MENLQGKLIFLEPHRGQSDRGVQPHMFDYKGMVSTRSIAELLDIPMVGSPGEVMVPWDASTLRYPTATFRAFLAILHACQAMYRCRWRPLQTLWSPSEKEPNTRPPCELRLCMVAELCTFSGQSIPQELH